MGTPEGFQPGTIERSSLEHVVHVASRLWDGAVWIDQNIIKKLYRDRGEEGVGEETQIKNSVNMILKPHIDSDVTKRIVAKAQKYPSARIQELLSQVKRS